MIEQETISAEEIWERIDAMASERALSREEFLTHIRIGSYKGTILESKVNGYLFLLGLRGECTN